MYRKCGSRSNVEIYWNFGVRWCKQCFLQNTLTDHRIKTDYGLKPESFQYVINCEIWANDPQGYAVKRYMRSDVLQLKQNKLKKGSLQLQNDSSDSDTSA